MITAYEVSYQEYNGDRFTFPLYLNPTSAGAHRQKLEDLRAEDAQVNMLQVDSLSSQKVTIHGDHAGYQFSRTKMGKRTFTLKVRNISQDVDTVTGEVQWNKRTLQVKHKFSNCWETVR